MNLWIPFLISEEIMLGINYIMHNAMPIWLVLSLGAIGWFFVWTFTGNTCL